MTAGRPSLYTEDILPKAKEYLALCKDTTVNVGNSDKPFFKTTVKVPTKGGLARFLGVSRDSLYEWATIYPEFSDIMEQLGAEQEDRLISNGLSGDYNPTIAKVLLTKHGYREGHEQTGAEGKPLVPETKIDMNVEELARKVGEEIIKQKANADTTGKATS